MNEIDFININQPLNLEQEFNLGNGYIKFAGAYEHTGDYRMTGEIIDANHNTIANINCYFHQDDHSVNVALYAELLHK